MLFGAATGTVLGKSLGGYADGQEDLFDGESRPMARFQLEEPTKDGDDSLTLEVTQAQYAQLMPGQSGKISWWGKKLSDFVVVDEPDEAMAEAMPQAEVLEPLPKPPQIPESAQQPAEPPTVQPILESASPSAGETEMSPMTTLAAKKTEMNCPWCGKPMGIWRMDCAQAGAYIKRGEHWAIDRSSMKMLFSSLKTEFANKIWIAREEKIRLSVCENCQKAVIDYKNVDCGESMWPE